MPRATRLILAGDIGRLADYSAFRGFLCSLCQKFAEVYLVLGNHEFFDISHEEGLYLADRLQHEHGLKDKLVVMNRKRVDLGDISLLGCTLHSRIPSEAEEIVRSKINDFRRIANWTVADYNAEHAEDEKWLADTITSIRQTASGTKRKIVVVSHHAPLTRGTSKPTDEGNQWSSAFATDLIGKNERSCLDDVQWWVFGHTHYSSESVCGQVKLVSNQRGYVLPSMGKRRTPETSGTFKFKLRKVLLEGGANRGIFDPEKVIET